MSNLQQSTKRLPARPPDRPASITEDESVNDGTAEDGPSIAKAASADTTPVRMAAAIADAANVFPPSFLLAIDRDVDEGRTLPLHDGVVKAADEPMDRTAAVIKTLDFMVLVLMTSLPHLSSA